jgi:tetratricopeptide (TPR) repeat protein
MSIAKYTNLDALLSTARQQLDAGHTEDALKALHRCKFFAPDDPRIYSLFCNAFVQLGDISSAIAHAKHAHNLQKDVSGDSSYLPQLVNAICLRGHMLAAMTWNADAERCFDEASHVAPKHAAPHAHRAVYLMQRKDLDKAQAQFEAALAIDGSHIMALVGLTHLYFIKGEPKKALLCYKTLVNVDPDSVEAAALGDRVEAYREEVKDTVNGMLIRNAYDEAVLLLTRTLDIFADDAELYYKRGICFRYIHEYQAAVQDLLHAVKLHGGVFDKAEVQLGRALNDIGMQLATEGRFADGLPYFTEALKWDCIPEYHVNRADCFHRSGNDTEAYHDLVRAVELDHSHVVALFRLSQLHCEWATAAFNSGRFSEAVEEFSKAIKYHNRVPVYYLSRARCYQTVNEPTRALEDMARCVALEPDNKVALQYIQDFCPFGLPENIVEMVRREFGLIPMAPAARSAAVDEPKRSLLMSSSSVPLDPLIEKALVAAKHAEQKLVSARSAPIKLKQTVDVDLIKKSTAPLLQMQIVSRPEEASGLSATSKPSGQTSTTMWRSSRSKSASSLATTLPAIPSAQPASSSSSARRPSQDLR